MAWNDREPDLRKLAFHGVKIGMADTADSDTDEDVFGTGFGCQNIHKLQGTPLDRSKFF